MSERESIDRLNRAVTALQRPQPAPRTDPRSCGELSCEECNERTASLREENAALRRALQNAAYAIEALADPNMDDWPTEEARASYAKLKKAEADAALV